jgi:membrane carboxypeptidase/penicillin-binding protein PbpC
MFKTGTANQFQDIWALGATPDYAAGVWMGNFSGETVIGRTGSSIPASIVREVLSLVRREGLDFPPSLLLRGEHLHPFRYGSYGALSLIGDRVPPEGNKASPCNYHTIVDGKRTIAYQANLHPGSA